MVSIYLYSRLISGTDKEGKEVRRSYTPITRVTKRGSMDLLVKVYYPTERFPEGGVLTQYLDKLKINDYLTICGPKGKVEYLGDGNFYFKKKGLKKQFKKITMLAGGSGITPCFQSLLHLLDDKKADLTLNILFANKTEEDIVLREELDEIAEKTKARVAYTLDHPKDGWKGYKGFINQTMLEDFIPPVSDDHLVFFCGPKLMNKDCRTVLKTMGFSEDNVFKF